MNIRHFTRIYSTAPFRSILYSDEISVDMAKVTAVIIYDIPDDYGKNEDPYVNIKLYVEGSNEAIELGNKPLQECKEIQQEWALGVTS